MDMSAFPMCVCLALQAKETDAKYTLADPAEVLSFLTRLLEWGATPSNAWHSNHACTGWSLRQPATPAETLTQAAPTPEEARPGPPTSSLGGDHRLRHLPDHDLHQQDDQNDQDHVRNSPQGHQDKGSSAQPQKDSGSNSKQAAASSSPSPGYSAPSGSAFATVRQFHGLPVSSDRAMPASQWLTKTDSLSQPKAEAAHAAAKGATAPAPAESAPTSRQQSSPDEQTARDEDVDESGTLASHNFAARRQMHKAGKAEKVEQIQAEGRPPTAEEESKEEVEAAESPSPPSRTSLDHYLRQPYKISDAGEGGKPSHMGHWDAGEGVMPESEVAYHSRSPHVLQARRKRGEGLMLSMPPFDTARSRSGSTMPEGKRLTALLLDKLQGHDVQRVSNEEGMSPPGHSSNSNSSMAGFESVAHDNMSFSEDTDSVKAEVGSVGSLHLAPSK